MKILYLGLRPKPGTYHYPVIRTELCADLQLPLSLWPQFTHLIFTSQTAVHYWPGPWDKELIAIGAATASALEEKGLYSLVAPEATQEGIMALVQTIPSGYFLLPRSKRARTHLTDFMERQKIPFLALDLYDTVCQKLEPVPNLEEFEEIIFTSPSTVDGFLAIYGTLPPDKKLTPIGPVTAAYLKESVYRLIDNANKS